MDAKFMQIKKVVLSMFTVVLISSQLCGCASVYSKDYCYKLIQQNVPVEITINELDEDNKLDYAHAKAEVMEWLELASKQTCPELRKQWDDILHITAITDGKNGVLYVNAKGEHDNNNTLSVAFRNREFVKMLEDTDTFSKLANAAAEYYTDIDADNESDAFLAGVAAYFGLLVDGDSHESNINSKVTRAEFMTMLTTSRTPVQQVFEDITFNSSVGDHPLNFFAALNENCCFITTKDKSLNDLNYNKSITRAEVAYAIANAYFKDEMNNFDASKYTINLNLPKAVDVATAKKFIDSNVDKQAAAPADANYIKSAVLLSMLRNPSEQIDTEFYKALNVCASKGLFGDALNGSIDTRWDEPATKSEVIEMLIVAAEKSTNIEQFAFKQATIDTNSVDDQQQQQVQDSNGEGSSIVEGDGSAAEGSWDEDPVDTTGDDQQAVETQQPEVQTGALTDYTQCAYYKTSKGKEHIERIINQVFGDLSTYSEIPSQFILKPLNSAEMQQMFKDLIIKNDCKNADEADNLKTQVLNTYVNTSGYLAYLQGGSSSQQTPQEQQAVQQAQDSGLLQPIGGDDSGSQGGDGGFTGEDPAGGVDEWGWDTYDWQVSECETQ